MSEPHFPSSPGTAVCRCGYLHAKHLRPTPMCDAAQASVTGAGSNIEELLLRADTYVTGSVADGRGTGLLVMELAAALRGASPYASGWQPIETAPEDHFTVLVYGKYGRLTAFRDVMWLWWPFPAHEPLDYTPTHWMPLPAAPSVPSTDREADHG